MLMPNRYQKIIILVLIFFVSMTSFVAARKRSRATRPRQVVSCRAAILSDATNAKRLYSKNAEKIVLPASTAKVMTAILVMEKLSLDDYVRVSGNANRVQPSVINVKPGEEYAVRDLLYAILLNSANDASIVLAEAVAGSERKFVAMMNRRARELGGKHTRFANAHGLPSAKGTQYTTAYDMYLMFRHALNFRFFQDAITKRYATIFSKDGRRIGLKSHNTVLFNNWDRKIYGKTGYTRRAGACFIGTVKDKGRTLIIGVFGCSRRWEDVRYIMRKHGGIAL